MKKIVAFVVLCATLGSSFLYASIYTSREALILSTLSDESKCKQRILSGEKKLFLPLINLFIYNIYYITDEKRAKLLKDFNETKKEVIKPSLIVLQTLFEKEWDESIPSKKGYVDNRISEGWIKRWPAYVILTCYQTLKQEYDLAEIREEADLMIEALDIVNGKREELKNTLEDFKKESKFDEQSLKDWGIDDFTKEEK